MNTSVILFELNEVPLSIIDEFCQWSPQSHLARRLPRCRVLETISQDGIRLSPWVTWPSVYRGVNDERHLIEHFGQDLTEVDREFPPLWKLLTAQGVKVGLFGTLHSYPMPEDISNYAFYVPDTFAAGAECFPALLESFQDFNLAMARDSPRNVSGRIHWSKALRLLRDLPDLGIRGRTLAAVGKQLAAERMQSWKRVRRRTFQPLVAFDIFMTQLERTRPQFATFFTNHVASSMHRYWAAAFPQDYRPEDYQFDDAWRLRYEHEIAFTMSKFDEMFGRLARFVEKNCGWKVIVATSMGQEATTAQPLETQLYLTDLAKFLQALGIEPEAWSPRPAMAPRVSLFVKEDRCEQLRHALRGLSIAGQPLEWHEKEHGFFNLRFGQANLYDSPCVASLDGRPVSFMELGLKNVEIQDKSNTTAYHVPTGSLLIYDPEASTPPPGRAQISTLDIAPYVLSLLGAPVPHYMNTAPTL